MRAAAILGLGCSAKDLTALSETLLAKRSTGASGCLLLPIRLDVILLFGGDGTIHRHLGQLVKLGLAGTGCAGGQRE